LPIEPRASYRVQLRDDFGFAAAAGIVDYLAELGVSHLYSSPCLQAVPGSTHGYDVVDPERVSAGLGGESGRKRLCEALDREGLGQLLDIVPNHMATHAANRWWWDVLAKGVKSPHARFFDIDWDPPEARLRGRILLPVLGDHIGREIASGALRRAESEVVYHEHRFPIRSDLVGETDLQALLDAQHYRLARWHMAEHDLNYRRFFDIDTLVGIRVEDPEVFATTHAKIRDWLSDGSIDGLRVDHPDGMRRPAEYLERLRRVAPRAWILVEKILAADEPLRAWPVDGTTGYDFIQRVGALFVDASTEAAWTGLYHELTGEPAAYDAVVDRAKRDVLAALLASDVRRVADRFVAVCESHPNWRDFTRARLTDAITETVVAFDVYRSYAVEDGEPDEADAGVIARATDRAKRRRPDLEVDLFELVRAVLLGELEGPEAGEARVQLQQLTVSATAKGVEDTAFYRYLRFAALNEVGGAPDRFGDADVSGFHDWASGIQTRWPRTMLSLSTHDSKRSEDVRARLHALSEMPEQWTTLVRRWMARHERHRRAEDRPDRNMEYLLYQMLVGAAPISRERAVAYMEKASREAKVHTSWRDPDPDYDAALRRFVEALYDDEPFLTELAALVRDLEGPGRVTSLAQKLVQLTAPGVPDLYQGTELWNLRLVDPDNRVPIDFERRRRMLAELRGIDVAKLSALEEDDQGWSKLWLVHRALGLRQRRPAAFGPDGAYRPLYATGTAADHVIAFVRRDEIITIVPRLAVGLAKRGGFRDTRLELPAGRWLDVLCDRTYASGPAEVGELLSAFPVALLAREEG